MLRFVECNIEGLPEPALLAPFMFGSLQKGAMDLKRQSRPSGRDCRQAMSNSHQW
jgi:hypothetical protein